MRAPTNQSRGSLEFNMTPMIDVVFNLIVFFVVASHLAKQEVQLELDLPTASQSQPASENQPRRVTVNVLPGGEIQLSGETVQPAALQSRIAAERRDAGNDIEVRIRADRTVSYGSVEPIMLACAKAGVWNVTFAVEKREAPR